MCTARPNPPAHPPAKPSALAAATLGGTAAEAATPLQPAQPPKGSRRRRLWELPAPAHCPVIGVCLPLHALRRVVDKLLGGQALADDYELHCGVISDSRQRSQVAEAVQRELDRRYAVALRRTQPLKDSAALTAWWAAESAGNDLAGALWATLTHARCDTLLEERVLREIHMLQHQVGTANRAELQRLNALHEENGVLARALAAAQGRSAQQAQAHSRRVEQLQAQLMQARAELIGRDTRLALLQEELQALEQAVPALRTRSELARQVAEQVERIQDLERALLRSRHETEREQIRANEAWSALQAAQAQDAPASCAEDTLLLADELADRAVLCVGGRQASVPVYRQLIEKVGGRFLHHDGGEEDSSSRLDTTLAAADLVICQTGCISHDAYWRVKDHCKRTGKRCVFVENPSSASLQRALRVTVTRHNG